MNNRSVWMRSKLLALVAGLAVGLGGLLVAAGRAFSPSPAASFKLADANEGPSRIGFAPVVKKVLPTVVNISSSKVVKTPAGFSQAKWAWKSGERLRSRTGSSCSTRSGMG